MFQCPDKISDFSSREVGLGGEIAESLYSEMIRLQLQSMCSASFQYMSLKCGMGMDIFYGHFGP